MAGAPRKKGLDYFSLDVDIEQDQKVELIEAEFGLKGFAILIKLFLRIYGDEGYFLRWNSDTQLLLAKRVGEPGSFVGEVVNGSVRRGLFNKSVLDQFDVLTSAAIQERYFNAIKRREKTEVVKEYLLVDVRNYINLINVNINSINARNNSQSRVEKSRYNTPNRAGAHEAPEEPPDEQPEARPENREAVIRFFSNNGMGENSAMEFFDHYRAQGWVRKNQMPIVCWQSAASQWIRREKHSKPDWKQKSKPKAGKTNAKPDLEKLKRQLENR